MTCPDCEHFRQQSFRLLDLLNMAEADRDELRTMLVADATERAGMEFLAMDNARLEAENDELKAAMAWWTKHG